METIQASTTTPYNGRAAWRRPLLAGLGPAVALSTCLLALGSTVAPATGATRAQRETLGIAGPPVTGDLELMAPLVRGARLLNQWGGAVDAIGAEPRRPILWTSAGPRVRAHDLAQPNLPVLGRSPALPVLIETLAVGDGVVVAGGEGRGSTLWLIDARDPTWPRAMRPLTLGGPVRGLAVDGRRAAFVVGDELLHVDLWPPDAPAVRDRHAIPFSRPGSREPVALALRDGFTALSDTATRILVLDPSSADPDDGPRFRAIRTFGHADAIALDQRHLYLRTTGSAHVYSGARGSAVLDSKVPTPTEPTRPSAVAFATSDDGLLVLWRADRGVELALQRLRWSSPLPGATLEATAAALALHPPRPRVPNTLAPRLTVGPPSEQGTEVIRAGGMLYTVPRSPDPRIRAIPGTWGHLSPLETARAVAARPGLLAVAERYGGVSLWDTDQPSLPRPLGRWQSRALLESPNAIEEVQLVGSTLWLSLHYGWAAVDVSDPRAPRTLDERIAANAGPVASDGSTTYLAFGLQILLFREPPASPATPSGTINMGMVTRALTLAGDHLWAAGDAGAGSRLQAIRLADRVEVGTYREDLGLRIGAMAATHDHLALLGTDTTGTARDRLVLLDIARPDQPEVVGELDLGASTSATSLGMPPPVGSVVAFGRHFVLSHPDAGTVVIDLSVPTLPDEITRLAPPGEPVRVALEGERAWIGTLRGGLALAQLGPVGNLDAGATLWLPRLGLAR